MDNGDVSKQRQPRRKKRHTLPRMRSSSRRKQQTLTQMDFVSFNSADLEDYDLDYILETDSHEVSIKNQTPSMPRTQSVKFKTEDDYATHNDKDATYQDRDHARPMKKRRKNRAQSLEPPKVYTTVQTRSSSRRISSYTETPNTTGSPVFQSEAASDTRERSIPHDVDASQTGSGTPPQGIPPANTRTSFPDAEQSQVVLKSDAIRMPPPPFTPHKQRLKEIPSSQSPPATPWSTKSTIALKSATQSPLQQKSANASKSAYTVSVRRKMQLRSALEIEDTFREDDKENLDSMPTTISSTLNQRRTPALSTRRPLQHMISSAGTEREVMADLAEITSAATSSIAEQRSCFEVATEIGDSELEEVGREIVNVHNVHRLEAHETGLEDDSTLSNIANIGEQEVVSPIKHTSDDRFEPESQLYDSLLGPIQRVERSRSQSTVSTILITPIKTSARPDIQFDPTTPCRSSIPNSFFDEAALQLQADLTKSTQPAFTNSTTGRKSDALDEPQSSPTLHRSQRDTRTPRSSRSVQRALELSVTKGRAHRGVDLGVLAGWKRMTESQRLDDSLLQDSIGVETMWDLDLEPDLDTQRSL